MEDTTPISNTASSINNGVNAYERVISERGFLSGFASSSLYVRITNNSASAYQSVPAYCTGPVNHDIFFDPNAFSEVNFPNELRSGIN